MEGCVLAVSSRQVRMHECKNCTVYLRCSSRPIIEDCTGIKFAPLPAIHVSPPKLKPPRTPLQHPFLIQEGYIEIDSAIHFPPPPPHPATLSLLFYKKSPKTNTSTPQDLPTPNESVHPNLWNQIDDFKWLKAEPSPNWSIQPTEDLVPGETWQQVISGNSRGKLDDLLSATKVV